MGICGDFFKKLRNDWIEHLKQLINYSRQKKN